MSSLNKAIIIGRIGKTPETRFTQSGQQATSFSVATDESYKDKQGNKVEATEWHNVTAWGKTSEFVANYLDKGRLVYVEGKLETKKYTAKDGTEKYTTKIIADRIQALDRKPDGQGQPAQTATGRQDMNEMDEAPF